MPPTSVSHPIGGLCDRVHSRPFAVSPEMFNPLKCRKYSFNDNYTKFMARLRRVNGPKAFAEHHLPAEAVTPECNLSSVADVSCR